MINITVFSGGRGARHIQEALAGADCNISYLINGYDSGKSTGRIRWALDRMLGPSDFRKSISTALQSGPAPFRGLAAVFENRHLLARATSLVADPTEERVVDLFTSVVPQLPARTAITLASWIRHFLDTDAVRRGRLTLEDLPLGNAVFAGAFLSSGMDFNSSVRQVQAALPIRSNVSFLNVTRGEDLWLAARAGDSLTVDEGCIVGVRPPSPIVDLALLSRDAAGALWGRFSGWNRIDAQTLSKLEEQRSVPAISSEARSALENADVIVYSCGTQHSSLLPSYMTAGVSEAIANNDKAIKVMFGNGERDLDFHPTESPMTMVHKTLTALASGDRYNPSQLISKIFLAAADWENPARSRVATSIHGIPVHTLGSSRITPDHTFPILSTLTREKTGHALVKSRSADADLSVRPSIHFGVG